MNNLIIMPQVNFQVLLFVAVAFGGFFFIQTANAQYGSACSEYGIMAYEDYSGYCKCMSGYVFQDSYLGKQCVSADSVCRDEYGSMSRYDSLSGSCECSYGYVLGKDSIGRTQCISDDKSCQNQLGYNSRATYGGQCECDYGYVIDGGQCEDGDSVCRSDHGINSKYNSLSNRCECNSGYTFDDDNRCIEKHNSAYFTLLDISEDSDELIIKSQYDSRNYIIEFGMGCWDYAIETYEGGNVVVNMGTDFSVDIFDILVLPNHDQNCSIMGVEWTLDDSFPEPEENDFSYYTPVNSYTEPSYTVTPEQPKQPANQEYKPLSESDETNNPPVFDFHTFYQNLATKNPTSSPTVEQVVDDSQQTEVEVSIFQKVVNFFKRWF